jgi:hypothetical protein
MDCQPAKFKAVCKCVLISCALLNELADMPCKLFLRYILQIHFKWFTLIRMEHAPPVHAPILAALGRAVRRAAAQASKRKRVRRKMRIKVKQRAGALAKFRRLYL